MAGGPPVLAAAPLNIDDPSFPSLAAAHCLNLQSTVSPRASARRHRVRDIYVNNPELQRIYQLGLVPFGQLHFLGWLTTHGRKDQQLTDADIMEFLRESAADEAGGICLTYLLQPEWQRHFPFALAATGWGEFRAWISATYGQSLRRPLPAEVPTVLSKEAATELTRLSEIGTERKTVPGVNVMSHFCNPSGIQQAAFWTKTALERAGLATSCRDVPVPRRETPDDRERWLGLEVFPVTILTHAANPYFLDAYERSGLFRRPEVYRIAYWAWELETIPDEWVKAAELVDEIWTPTEFVANAMRTRLPKPVYRMLPGVEVGPVEKIPRASLGVPEDHFVFLFMFDLHSQLHRKNPEGVVRAFQMAFRQNDAATLVIKTTGGDIHTADLARLREIARGPNVLLLEEMMPRAKAYGLIAMADCFVSLHRSEGFGLGMSEAMLLGKPVIATAYSGNLDFMNHDNSYLVDYERTEILEDRPIYTRGNFWAEPSVEQAARYMREIYDQPDKAHDRAARAEPVIAELLSLDAAGRRMRERLDQVAAS